jgi:hypothetical protein
MILNLFNFLHLNFKIKYLSVYLLILLWTVVCGLWTVESFSQNGISVNRTGAPANNSAILDVSSTSQGLLIPRMTTTHRDNIASTATSLLIFNTTTNCFEAYVNGSWYSLSCAPACTPPTVPVAKPATNSGCTSFNANWSNSPGSDAYYLDVSTDAGFSSPSAYVSGYNNRNVGNVSTFYISGLDSNTTYFYRVRAAFGDCLSASSNIISAHTIPCQHLCPKFQGTIHIVGTQNSGITYGYSGKETPDGGFILAGSTGLHGAGLSDAYLVKLKGDGSFDWSKAYGGTGIEDAAAVMFTPDGGYALAGYSVGGDIGDDGVCYLIKTDNKGNYISSFTYNLHDVNGGLGIACGIITSDRGFIFTSNPGDYILKVKENGEIDWCKKYNLPVSWGTRLNVYSIEQTSDGGYVVAAYGGTSTNMFNIIKIDAKGNVIWNKAYGGGSGMCVRQTKDGGYIALGLGLGGTYPVLIKTDGNGNLIWTKQYYGYGYNPPGSLDLNVANEDMLQLTDDGGYIFIASFNPVMYDEDYCIIKTDANGNITGSNAFAGPGLGQYLQEELTTSIKQTSDGGYFIIGVSNGFEPNWVVYYIKTDADLDGGACRNYIPTLSSDDQSLVTTTPALKVVNVNPDFKNVNSIQTPATETLNNRCPDSPCY